MKVIDNEKAASEIIEIILPIDALMIMLSLSQSLYAPKWNKEVFILLKPI